ncbi:FG-GAP repeat domain-containing protein [Streptomyces sp. NPDC014870]|uniref:FG-GAP repeat domain-containing protein n=1 Tax=Streptomyces sp. NPDC014870 TaxID=3364925 RepID=UPI0036FD935C
MHHVLVPRRRRLTLSVGVVLALTVGGALAVPSPALALTAVDADATQRDETADVAYPRDARIVGVGSTGFLTWGVSGGAVEERWTRFADGSSTVLAGGPSWVTASAASDVVTLNQGSHVTLRDMAAGKDVLSVDLRNVGTHGGQYAGTVESMLLVRTPGSPGGETVHILSQDGDKLSDRVVTGLPADATSVYATGSRTSGHVLLTYMTRSGAAEKRYWALMDRATATVTETREIVSPGQWTGRVALSATHVAWVEYDATQKASVVALERGTGTTQRVPLVGASRVEVGLVGDWVTYADRDALGDYHPNPWGALRARNLTTGATRTLTDHVKWAGPGPDGAQFVQGGTVARGEGLYRIAPGADGVPVAEPVASTGESTKVTLLGHDIPAQVSPAPGDGVIRLDWRLSRVNVVAKVTLRHVQSGKTRTEDLYPSGDLLDDPHAMRFDWQGDVPWKNEPDMPTGAPNGTYTWTIDARPLDGIGPNLVASGSFDLTHAPAPHDYDDDGSPDVLARDTSGRLWRGDAFYRSESGQLDQLPVELIGAGWQVYDRIEAAGNLGGLPVGDLVARDKAGVLWLYLGKGDGTFATRTRIGAGWNAYTQLTAGSDLNGDGRPDLLATDTAGDLYLYKATGNPTAPFSARTKIGHGWGIYNQLTATGNIAGAAPGDLVARDKAGVLWLYTGRGDGTFTPRTRIGSGWGGYGHLLGVGDADRDGRPDLYASGADGTYLHKGTGDWRAPFRPREVVGVYSDGTDRRYNHFA